MKSARLVAFTIVLLLMWSSSASAQAIAGPRVSAPTPDDWGLRLKNGIFWGQIFGGLAGQSSKTTFKRLAAEIWWDGNGVSFLNDRRWSSDISRAATTQVSSTTSTTGPFQFGGSLDFANYSFGNGAGGFTVSSFMGGIRYLLPIQPRFQPYVQVSAGIEHSFEESALALQPAAGVIFPIGKWFATAGGGIRTAFYEGASETGFLLNVGLTIPFGQP